MIAAARMFTFRVAVVLVAAAGCVLAWRAGGGAEAASIAPRPDDLVDASVVAAPAKQAVPPQGPEGYQITARLVELAKDARVDAPNAATGQKFLGAHWRKMRPAWFVTSGAAARLVTSISLRTSIIETQWSQPTGGGKAWSPDAKVWNMNEGSFNQRDALVATPPTTFTFRVAVPPGGKLTFAEGSINTMRDATVFTITAVAAAGSPREIYRHRLPPASSRRWTDASCSLAAFAGQTIELRLTTEAAAATPEERHDLAKEREAVRRAERDAGGPDAAAPPTTTSAEADGGPPKEEILSLSGPPVALWGSPTVLGRTVPQIPYNVLWIVVDALRPDVIASFHDDADDAAKQAAPNPPLEALLPKVPGLTPSIDALAKRGVRFTNAYSGGSWTRPGTISMLAGARSSELGIDTTSWVLQPPDVARFYASDPPLLPLIARRHGVATHAFVNNYFMVGYTPVGIEMGFEHVVDHRYRTRDSLEITRDASAWIRANRDTRFFLFANFNSPHEPYEPPPHLLERVPAPPAGPEDKMARLYMAEAAKDDEAIGALVRTLDEQGLRDRTIIVVTANHGETMSSAHHGTSALDKMPIRYHHAVSNYEETTRVPILVVAPGLLPEDRAVKERVRGVDLAPTVSELLGLEAHPRFSGRSLVPLAKGQKEADERVVVTEGRGTRGIIHDRYRLITRDGAVRTTHFKDRSVTVSEELYDLVDDPGERRDLAPSRPERVAEMRARLDAALKNTPVAGSAAATAANGSETGKPPKIHVRFVGGPRPRRVSGTITVGDAKTKTKPKFFTIEAIELGHDAMRLTGERAELAFTTHATASVGFDIVVDPPTTPVKWELYLDDKPWPEDAIFGGPYGLIAPSLRAGITTDDARLVVQSPLLPPIDPRREVGMFVVRERRGEVTEAPAESDEGAEEMARLLREWGYAHGSGGGK